MRLTVCPLFSGSSGNSVYIACGGVRLLVDAGVSAARVEANLDEIGVSPEELDAILVTHEHIDHIRGLSVLSRKYGVPIYANEGTWTGIEQKASGIPMRLRRTFYTGEEFSVGRMSVHPFAIPHDAQEPVGYAFSCGTLTCGVATDIGCVQEDWLRAVSGCQALVLEANHDVEMVERGPYPAHLKRRILGRRGHLNNEDCARALLELARGGTRAVFLAHLSADNNLPELAYNTVCGALERAGYAVGADMSVCVARRDRVSDMLVLEDGQSRAAD